MEADLEGLSGDPVRKPINNVLSSKTLEIEAAFPHVQPLLRSLEHLGSAVVWAHRRGSFSLDDYGLVLIRFSGQIEANFGLTREVALVVVPYDNLRFVTYRDLPGLLKTLPREVTDHVVLVASRDSAESRKLDDWSTPGRLAIGVGHIAGSPQQAARQFVETLRKRIFSRNPYAATAPVHDDSFFGRRLVVQELVDSIASQKPVALVGLRKSGKTSLLQETAASLARESRSVFVLRDLESLPQLPEPVVPELIRDLAQDVSEQLEASGEKATGVQSLPADASVSDFRRAMKSDLRKLSGGKSLTIALDEIEYLCPPGLVTADTPNGPQVTQFFGSLRSLVQETHNFSFIVAGLTPDLFRRGMLFGRHNPLFSWVTARYVRPFSEAEAADMLQALGRRMGIQWETNAIGLAVSRAGGHAYMLRQLGAAVAEGFDASQEDRIVTADRVRERLDDWKQQVKPNIEEAKMHVKRYYQVEYKMLSLLIERGADGVLLNDRLRNDSDAFQNLHQLGLVTVDNQDSESPIVRAVDYLVR